jgi:hypothetical protein
MTINAGGIPKHFLIFGLPVGKCAMEKDRKIEREKEKKTEIVKERQRDR